MLHNNIPQYNNNILEVIAHKRQIYCSNCLSPCVHILHYKNRLECYRIACLCKNIPPKIELKLPETIIKLLLDLPITPVTDIFYSGYNSEYKYDNNVTLAKNYKPKKFLIIERL